MACTIFHLIRHGEHDVIGHAVAGGTEGISLNARGRAQAEAIAAALVHRPLAAIIAAPLERTQETAAPLASRRGIPVRVEAEVIDIDFREWTMVPFDRLHHDLRWRMFYRFRSGTPNPGGETMAAVQARAVGTLLRLRREFPSGDVTIFCHGDVIKSMIMHLLGVALDFVHRIEISPGSRSPLMLEEESAKLLALNLPASAPEPPYGRAARSPNPPVWSDERAAAAVADDSVCAGASRACAAPRGLVNPGIARQRLRSIARLA